jgi:hypothetical protein
MIEDLGPFDTDPCAGPEPRPWPTASRHITLPQDGLAAEWEGLVWCNPPYSYKQTWPWLAKLAGHPDGGIALVFARTDTEGFFKEAWSKADGFLFVKGRIDFCRPDGVPDRKGAGAPSVLIGYTDEAMRRLAGSKIEGHLIVNSAAIVLRSDGTPFGTWREVISSALAGKEMRLRDLYTAVEDTAKVRCAKSKGVEWRSKIRRVLQEHFCPVERGVWGTA